MEILPGQKFVRGTGYIGRFYMRYESADFFHGVWKF